jgi:hypothetical protein
MVVVKEIFFHLLDATTMNSYTIIILWKHNRPSYISSDFSSKFVRNECRGALSSTHLKRETKPQVNQITFLEIQQTEHGPAAGLCLPSLKGIL